MMAKFLRQRKRLAAAAAPRIIHCTLFPRPLQMNGNFFYYQPDFCDPVVRVHLIYETFLHLFTQNVKVKITLAQKKTGFGQILVTQLRGVTSYMQPFYIFLHKT